MPGHPDYEFSSGLVGLVPASDADDIRWNIAAWLVHELKHMATAPWVTVGSSRDGNDGISNITVYSATPDGVDHWTGGAAPLTRKQVTTHLDTSTTTVWHVLRQPLTGVEICIGLDPTTGGNVDSSWFLTVAQNGFSTGGVSSSWRTAPTGPGYPQRPQDVTSTPVANQEIPTDGRNFLPGSTTYQIFVANRKDGRGFYAFVTNNFANGDLKGLISAHQITNPKAGQTNLWLALKATSETELNTGLSQRSMPSGRWRGRTAAGTLKDLFAMEWSNRNDGTGTVVAAGGNIVDPWLSAYPVTPAVSMSASGNANIIMHGTAADIFQAYSGIPNGGDSLNVGGVQGTHIVLGQGSGGVAIPWDGTNHGTPRNVYDVTAIGTLPTPPAPSNTDYKRFGQGLENV